MEKLKEYHEKRDFKKTTEPKQLKVKQKTKQLPFTIQLHLARNKHYDFRLAWDGVLLSWAVPKGPSFNPQDKRLAVHVEDHPLSYGDFEGIIPQGQYGGGTVMLFDQGYWYPINDINQGLRSGNLKFLLAGQRFKGQWSLIRTVEPNWLLRKENDQYSDSQKKITSFKKSIKSGKTLQEIEKSTIKNPFFKVEVKKAKLTDFIPRTKQWIYEIKYDGYRIVSFIENGKVRLLTRNGLNYQDKFKKITASLETLSQNRAMILDGEIVVFVNQDGQTSFQALQNYLKNNQAQPSYIIFDLLALDGKDLRNEPLINRKKALKKLLVNSADNLYYSSHVEASTAFDFNEFSKRGYEGIICKNKTSFYNNLKNNDWLKIKCYNRQEFVIIGYTISPQKSFKSLLLGYFEKQKLVYAGKVGTGFTIKTRQDLIVKFEKLIRKTPPLTKFKNIEEEEIVWLRPRLLAEIQFAEWTQDHFLRQASFKGLRLDKKLTEVIKETVTNLENTKDIKITNPEKLLFKKPKVTKQNIIDYYLSVAKRMLPYISNRVLSVVNCPNGVSGSCFFKKHPTTNQGFKTIKLDQEAFYLENEDDLLLFLQNNTIEFHPWGSQISDLDKPDVMVFDLDPDEGMNLDTIRQGAKDLALVLEELSLKAFLKTSGQKGYHLVVPFTPNVDWKTFKAFAQKVALVMEQRWPNKYTSNIRKNKRKGKIFIDWLRNSRGATSIAPYSIRAKEGAKVSMPIEWDELFKIRPDGISLTDALLRLKTKDPWKDYFLVQNLQKLKKV